jgi:hypothetical protein
MNLHKCRRCRADIRIESRHATNRRFCSQDCYETWWNEYRSENITQAGLAIRMWGPAPVVELDARQCAWLAALIDGEGTIGIWRQRVSSNRSGWHYHAAIQVTNSNKDLIDAAQECLNGAVHLKNGKRRNPRHKLTYAVTVKTRAVAAVLKQVRPYLVAKRKQADVVLEFCRVRDESPVRTSVNADIYQDLRDQCRLLNRRGTSGG